jgi:hypothetical protein
MYIILYTLSTGNARTFNSTASTVNGKAQDRKADSRGQKEKQT